MTEPGNHPPIRRANDFPRRASRENSLVVNVVTSLLVAPLYYPVERHFFEGKSISINVPQFKNIYERIERERERKRNNRKWQERE